MKYEKNPEFILSIGLPVFNGEEYITQRIKSILSQTFGNFELIISNNASEDRTDEICSELLKKDSRIRYHKQEENIGIEKNFKFVLDHANYDFFVWAGVDDIWEETFLEKNMNRILNNDKLIGCVSKVVQFEENPRRTGSKFRKFANKINSKFSKYGSYPIRGTYEERIRICLKINSAQNVYGVFRTKKLQESFVKSNNSAADLCIILKILEYGEIDVVNENLMKCRTTGYTGNGKWEILISSFGIKSIIFPHYTFMKWFLTNLGIKLFLKNFDLILKMNFGAILAIIYDLYLKKSTKL
jgi:glycosyltransferase involved in cell wall biosynthesis